MNDNTIRDFFHQNRPATADDGAYLAELKSRLDAIEEIKRIHDIEIARCRRRTIVSSLCGIGLGAAVMVFIILRPVSFPKLNATFISSAISFFAQWKILIVTGIAISALILGVIPWGKSKNFEGFI